eukprot:gnl/Dysnectes_brevis/1730_a1969_2639.p1 GENE.gnl/Dysnectes_brevis/1730_a1969_2639~~gnl/Dysnectes_brevis/1730_a1969_2639.p1  ORF type:complete len:228 (+),score=56.07 gnl/Dysnectes_brevis/1730_a1969_2639:52-735(+)
MALRLALPHSVYFKFGCAPVVIPELESTSVLLVTSRVDGTASSFIASLYKESHPASAKVFQVNVPTTIPTEKSLATLKVTLQKVKPGLIIAVGNANIATHAALARIETGATFVHVPTCAMPVAIYRGKAVTEKEVIEAPRLVPDVVIVDSSMCIATEEELEICATVSKTASEISQGTGFQVQTQVAKLLAADEPTKKSRRWVEKAAHVFGLTILAYPSADALVKAQQ